MFCNYDILEIARKWVWDIYNINWEQRFLGTIDRYYITIKFHGSIWFEYDMKIEHCFNEDRNQSTQLYR